MPRCDDEVVVYLGLGSNLGDRRAEIAAAVGDLERRRILRELLVSPLYETDAVSDDWQPPYLNAVVRGLTRLTARAVLSACLEIEMALGRVRPADRPKAPRLIDIDLLLYCDVVIDAVDLSVPHRAMLERPFVLIPLADVAAPGLAHPITGTVLTLAAPTAHVRALVPPLVPR